MLKKRSLKKNCTAVMMPNMFEILKLAIKMDCERFWLLAHNFIPKGWKNAQK